MSLPKGEHTCRGCGCTDIQACRHDNGEPCHWVEDDLCSVCHDKKAEKIGEEATVFDQHENNPFTNSDRCPKFVKNPDPVKMIQVQCDFVVNTAHGPVNGNKGDWLAENYDGELYPLNNHTKKKMYTKVGETQFPVRHTMERVWTFIGSAKFKDRHYEQTLVLELRTGCVLRVRSFSIYSDNGPGPNEFSIGDPREVMEWIPGVTLADFKHQAAKAPPFSAVILDQPVLDPLLKKAIEDMTQGGLTGSKPKSDPEADLAALSANAKTPGGEDTSTYNDADDNGTNPEDTNEQEEEKPDEE